MKLLGIDLIKEPDHYYYKFNSKFEEFNDYFLIDADKDNFYNIIPVGLYENDNKLLIAMNHYFETDYMYNCSETCKSQIEKIQFNELFGKALLFA